MKHLILLVILLSLMACSKSDEPKVAFQDCEQIANSYKEYEGENIGCQYHYVLTEYKNHQFIELVAHCDDLSRPFVIDEYCKDICKTLPYDPDSACGKYMKGRKVLKILFIRE